MQSNKGGRSESGGCGCVEWTWTLHRNRTCATGRTRRAARPAPGLGAYAVSKAALDKLVEAWRAEHSGVSFTRCIVGDCAGGQGESATGFADNWDWDLAGEFHPIWTARGLLAGSLIDVEQLV